MLIIFHNYFYYFCKIFAHAHALFGKFYADENRDIQGL